MNRLRHLRKKFDRSYISPKHLLHAGIHDFDDHSLPAVFQSGPMDLSDARRADGPFVEAFKHVRDLSSVFLFDNVANDVEFLGGAFVLQYRHGVDPNGGEGVSNVGRAHLSAFDVESLQFEYFFEASRARFFVQCFPGLVGAVEEHVEAVMKVGGDGEGIEGDGSEEGLRASEMGVEVGVGGREGGERGAEEEGGCRWLCSSC